MSDMATSTTNVFVHSGSEPWEDLGNGVRRKLLAYENDLMMVEVDFKKGAVGEPHAHPHVQCAFVKAGTFDADIGGAKQRLEAGDSFVVPSGVVHSVVAVTDGTLIDVFTPMRKDFVS